MKPYLKMVVAAVMLAALIIALTYGKDALSLEADVDTTLATLFPGLFIVTVGFIMVGVTRGIYLFPATGALGIGFAILFEELDALSLITGEMYSGLTLGQLQTWLIILGFMFGGVIGFATSR